MEIRMNGRLTTIVKRIIEGVSCVSLICICSCSCSDSRNIPFSGVSSVGHVDWTVSPGLSTFPLTGIVRVDGKTYRFCGGDSLRMFPLASFSEDDISGWECKYTFLFPGKGWEQPGCDESSWQSGRGGFGFGYEDYPVHTAWVADNLYVRRQFEVTDKEALRGHKMYVRYVCDDQLTIYCNGQYWFKKECFTPSAECHVLTDEDMEAIRTGDNLLAVYGRNTGGPALMDFGLYVENKTYADADTALLQYVDIQATQAHYVFQCGDLHLRLDFVSSSMSEQWNMTGWPVGFVSYRIEGDDDGTHEVEILFDMDVKCMFGKAKAESRVDGGWRLVRCEGLHLAMKEGAAFTSEEGHIVLSQKLGVENGYEGILVVGYEEGEHLLFAGESLHPVWNGNGERTMNRLMQSVGNHYQEIKADCDRLDCKWNSKAFGKRDTVFARQMLPAYRDFVASHRFFLSSDNKLFCFADTLGNVSDAYESFPVLSFFHRIDWMKALLEPVFEYCGSSCWQRKHPPYDMGLYPVASRQVKEGNSVVETTADMLEMVLAIVEEEQDFAFAGMHWAVLCQWADFLENYTIRNVASSDASLERTKKEQGLSAYRELVRWKEKG